MTPRKLASHLVIVSLLVVAGGCADPNSTPSDPVASVEMPPVETKADSVAMTVLETMGGPAAWANLPYLRFDFASGTEDSRTVRARHLWDRMSGDYRIEMPAGEDSVYVALFNVNTQEGDVYLNGEPVAGSEADEMLQNAYRRYINDTYWLLMPVKLFDPGVNRQYVADSSDGEHDVLHLTFGDVGLTPGDQYWVYVNKQTGLVDYWAYHLQGHPADHVPEPISWAGYETFETPHGAIVISERKPRGGGVLYTDNVAVPIEAPDGAFTNPQPIL